MKDTMMYPPDYKTIAGTLTKELKISGSPVAVKFAKDEEGIPEGVKEIEEEMRHCQMVSLARKEGRIFYARGDKHVCAGGAWALGLKELTPTLQTGEFYFKLGKFESWASCMRTIQNVPFVHPPASNRPSTYATVYAPLEKTPFDPHVVLIIAQPLTMLKLAQSILFKLGGRIESSFSGIQSLCADTCTVPYMTGKANFSLGCDGSRKHSGIDDDLLVMGIPGERIAELAEVIPTITGAAGSKK